MSDEVDLFVIGAGSGGVRAGRLAAATGAKVMVAEEYRAGGTCVIRGCVPKKLMVYASRFAEEFEDAAGFGWSVPDARFDWATLIANKDKEIARLEGLYAKNLAGAGAELVMDRAIVKDPHTVHLVKAKRDIPARTILVATGGTPWAPTPKELPGVEHVISSNEIFHLKEMPRRIVIAGGGYIAIEFACMLRGLGAEVTLVYRGDGILRGFDQDLRPLMSAEMAARGIRIVLNTVFERVDLKGTERHVRLKTGETLIADEVLMAVGRVPATKDLGLGAAGVALDKNGAVMVDDYGCTNVPSIWAVGDVTDRLNLTPVAIRDGVAFVETVFHDRPTAVDRMQVPTAVFGTPEIGTVGLNEEDARRVCEGVDIYKAEFRPMKATMSGRQTKMFMKLVVEQRTDRVVGCHILGESAAEMTQILGILVKMKARKADFDATVALHPSAAEELVLMRTKS
ncbi:MAG: glutathione-disulfide reductase [Alphaproteobacteria bacterium]|nr:glutathione-disulfide reductase [Alphaproteobacteria bacterium]